MRMDISLGSCKYFQVEATNTGHRKPQCEPSITFLVKSTLRTGQTGARPGLALLPREMGASDTEVLALQHWQDYFPR